MNNCRRQWLCGVAIYFCVGAAYAASVRVELSSRSITDDDDVQVTFTFEGQGQGELPDLDAEWRTVGTSQQISTNFVNGQMYRNRAQTLVLRPKRQGRLTIGSARITQGGRVVAQSSPVQVIVRGLQALTPSAAERAQNLPASPFLLVPRIARDIQYVGEPFVVEYILLIEDGQRVTDFGMRDVEYPGAIQRESAMEERFERVGTRKLNGKNYAEAVVFREVWKVLQPEVVTAPSQKLIIEVGGRSFMRNRKTLKAPPLKLDVRPVPSKGRPAAYREGAVGRFQITAAIDADDARGRALLDVKIAGVGSLRTLDAPSVSVSGAVVQELPNDGNGEIKVDKAGVSGTVGFQYLLTPERVGTVFVKPMEFCFFDPGKSEFVTVRTSQLTWNAKTAGPQRINRPLVQADTPVSGVERTLRPIITEAVLSSDSSQPTSRKVWFPYAVAAPFAVFLAFELMRVVRKFNTSDSTKGRRRRAGLLAQKQLLQVEGNLGKGHGPELYASIASALHGYLNDKHGTATTGMAKQRLVSLLKEQGYDSALTDAILVELEAYDAARFSPSRASETELKAALSRARGLIERMEAQS